MYAWEQERPFNRILFILIVYVGLEKWPHEDHKTHLAVLCTAIPHPFIVRTRSYRYCKIHVGLNIYLELFNLFPFGDWEMQVSDNNCNI